MYRFSLSDMRLFLAVADAQNLTRGAAAAALSASSASARLRNLEEALGVRLFVREARGLTLTQAGMHVYRYAREMLGRAGELEHTLSPFVAREKGVIRIVANYGASLDYLPAELAAFMSGNAHVRIMLEQMPSERVTDSVRHGVADFGVCVPESTSTGLEVVPFREDELVLITPPAHPLAARRAIAFREALGFDFVALTAASAMQQFVTHKALEAETVLEPKIRVDNPVILMALVMSGVGIAVVSRSSFSHFGSRALCAVKLIDDWAVRSLALVRPEDEREMSPVSLRLFSFLAAGAQARAGCPPDLADSPQC